MANEFGFGYRQAPPAPGSTPSTQQGQAAPLPPSLDALKAALMGQQSLGRAGAIRGSMRRPTEAKNLPSTIFDLWRSGRAEKEGTEQIVKSEEIRAKAEQEQRQQEADAVYGYIFQQLKARGVPPDEAHVQAKTGAQAVLTGRVDVKDILPEEKEPEDERPSTQKLAESMGLTPGTPDYNDYIRQATISKSGTTFNIPAGFTPIDPANPMAGIKPIPGSEQEREMLEAQKAGEKKEFVAREQYGHVSEIIKEAKSFLKPLTTGIPGKVMQGVPGSERVALEGYIDTLKANLTFDALEAMKSQSAVGSSGLGQLSDREGRLLGARVASLDTDQPLPVLLKNLDYIETHYGRFLDALDGKIPEGYDKEGNPMEEKSGSEEVRELNGRRYIKRDGQWYEAGN